MARVEAIEARHERPRRTGPPTTKRPDPDIRQSTMADRDTLTGIDATTLVLTKDTFQLWRRVGEWWQLQALPVCNRCDENAVAAIAATFNEVTFACEQHRADAVDFGARTFEVRDRALRQRNQLRATG